MKIDLHAHSYYSNDGCSPPEKLIKRVAQKGIDGIALTDHNTTAGWNNAKKAAKKYGIFLILGEEIKTRKNGKMVGDILGIFLKKEIKSRDPDEVIKEIKEQNGVTIIPHPFHWFTPFKGDLGKYAKLVDAIEVLNGRLPSKSVDRKALDFAKKNNMSIVGGSDVHYWRDVGDAYTVAKGAKNLEDFKKAILDKKTRTGGKKSHLRSLITPLLAKFNIIGNPPRKEGMMF
jgi:hypothetical protein